MPDRYEDEARRVLREFFTLPADPQYAYGRMAIIATALRNAARDGAMEALERAEYELANEESHHIPERPAHTTAAPVTCRVGERSSRPSLDEYIQSRLDDRVLAYMRLRTAFLAHLEAGGATKTEALAKLRSIMDPDEPAPERPAPDAHHIAAMVQPSRLLEPAPAPDARGVCGEPEEWGWYVEGSPCHSGFASRAEAIRHAVVEYEVERFLVGPMVDVDLAQIEVSDDLLEDLDVAEIGILAPRLADHIAERLEIEDNGVFADRAAQEALNEWATEYLRVTALPGAQEALDAWAREHLVSDCDRYCAGNTESEPSAEEIAKAKASAAPSCTRSEAEVKP